MLTSIGYNFDTHKKDVDHKFRIDKLLLLADADVDGGHISVLLLTSIYKFTPELFEQGKVYAVDAPLFSAYYKGKRYFGDDFNSTYKKLPKSAPKNIVMRSKGWGEIDPDTLADVAFNQATRKIIRIMPAVGKDRVDFEFLMGKNSAARKQLLGL